MTENLPPERVPPDDGSPPGADAEPPPGEVPVCRQLDDENDLLVVRADFEPLFAGYLDHVRRWEREPDGFGQVLMRQGLGAAVLHLSGRPPGENLGWTIHLHQPPTNIFLTGDSADNIVTGRLYTEHVKTDEPGSRMIVQSSRAGRTPTQSTIAVEGIDVLKIFEQYYRQSEQTPARLFEISDTEFVMLQALPEADHEWLLGLGRDEALGIAEDDLRPLDTPIFRYRCGCSARRMVGVMRELFRRDPDELFHGDGGVEISCPRCGRRWWVDREEFLAEDPESVAEPTPGAGSEVDSENDPDLDPGKS